jgi:hypothetical protein
MIKNRYMAALGLLLLALIFVGAPAAANVIPPRELPAPGAMFRQAGINHGIAGAGVNYTLSVTSANGTVTSSPSGISCGATCSASYASGTVVTLSASASGGYTFTGWSGSGCSGTGTCVVTMSGAESVTASYSSASSCNGLSGSDGGLCDGSPNLAATANSPTLLNYATQTTCNSGTAGSGNVTVTGSAGNAGTWCRPAWPMPGVDYYVGYYCPGGLSDPTTATLPSGASYAANKVTISGNNVTLTCFDFSLHGGIGLLISGANDTLKFNNIVSTPQTGILQINSSASAPSVIGNIINGNQTSGDATDGEIFTFAGTGGFTFEYNYCYYTYQHCITIESSSNPGQVTVQGNFFVDGAWGTGAHLNFLQWVVSGGGAITGSIISFNMFYQQITNSNGELIQTYNNDSPAITGATVNNNAVKTSGTIVGSGTFTGPAVSYALHVGAATNGPSTGVAENNWADLTSAYGMFYPGLLGFTFSGNQQFNGSTCNIC